MEANWYFRDSSGFTKRITSKDYPEILTTTDNDDSSGGNQEVNIPYG